MLLLAGCASQPRQLMPTPLLYEQSGGRPVFTAVVDEQQRGDMDLLYITDRAPETDPHNDLPYGQQRARRIVFGSATVHIAPGLGWDELRVQSRLGNRTAALPMSLGAVREIGHYPREPYDTALQDDGELVRDDEQLRQHDIANDALRAEVQRRLELSPSKKLMLYVHGFNETFATAAFTTAELCHFLGREDLCAFFTWPASSTGNFLISYAATTESAQYAVEHLKKVIRTLARTPGVEELELLAHSRGSAVLLSAMRALLTESFAAGREPAEELKVNNMVLFSPDIDADLAGQALTGHVSDPDLISAWPDRRLPRSMKGRFTVYASPEDRALRFSRILFRSKGRLGNLRPEDIDEDTQRYISKLGSIDFVVYDGEHTDDFGHSYFVSNPVVSSDVIQLLRFGRAPGDPGRDLVKKGPLVWEFASGTEDGAARYEGFLPLD